jgi:raffinose/stachyose/melibiose transport system permease protein
MTSNHETEKTVGTDLMKDGALSESVKMWMPLKRTRLQKNKKRWKNITIYLVLVIYCLVNAYPIAWMMMNSLKTEKEFALNPFLFPHEWAWDNYAKAWETARLGTYFWNSILVSVIAVVITVFLGALAAYFLARFEFRWNKWIYSFFLLGMLIPVHATLVPMFILMRNLDLLDTRISLVLPYVAFNLPITIFILVSYMKAFPREIEESAVMDGCGIFRTFWSIILPMARPALASAIILNFINDWNEFAFALVLINDADLKTVPLGLANFAGQFTTNYGAQMAGLTMALIPTLVLYLLMEKHLVKGMTAGAVKG